MQAYGHGWPVAALQRREMKSRMRGLEMGEQHGALQGREGASVLHQNKPSDSATFHISVEPTQVAHGHKLAPNGFSYDSFFLFFTQRCTYVFTAGTSQLRGITPCGKASCILGYDFYDCFSLAELRHWGMVVCV